MKVWFLWFLWFHTKDASQPIQGLRGQWTEEAMTRAVEAVTAGMSLNKASITYALPRRTLRR
ncbi:hypothetical protein NQ314_015042 [Rhamnusium bicolor]|uniref:HTH psq-type domain-containing protein n=1 Tax=Rhamnusium bicolor TaxID=1586634 RepID=A0AAV8X032_9CUCU|nr:hypothetical protein NQ314_015042 [Rhamnusium bicolor]